MTTYYKDLGNDSLAQTVNIGAADIQVPTEVQGHRTQNILTQNAVALTNTGGATPTSTSAYYNVDGFDTLSIVQKSSASHSGRIQILWSIDGTTAWVYELVSTGIGNVINTGTFQYRVFTIPVRAQYFAVYFENQDATVAPTVSVNAYLKA